MTAAPPAAEDARLRAFLAGRPCLFAYGLLGDVTARFRRLGFDYMGAQQAWLRAQGALPQVVPVPTGAAIAANARVIRAALSALPGDAPPALLIAHSKGGLEALAALLDPAAEARCAAFIAFQSPFRGTAVADAVTGRSALLHGMAQAALRMLGCGDGAGLRDLTTPVREAWMREHAQAIAGLCARMPVVSAATVLDPGRVGPALGRDRAYGLLVRALHRAQGPNDGLVPASSALLAPPARRIEGPGGHVALVSAGPGRDPVAALEAALRAALER